MFADKVRYVCGQGQLCVRTGQVCLRTRLVVCADRSVVFVNPVVGYGGCRN